MNRTALAGVATRKAHIVLTIKSDRCDAQFDSAAPAPPLRHEDRKPHEARRGEPADLVIWVEILTQLRLNVLRKTATLPDNSLSASPEPSGNGLSKDKLKTTEG